MLFSSITVFDDAYDHSMFNSDEKFEVDYIVHVATTPEFPQIDEPSQFLVRVTNAEYEEVSALCFIRIIVYVYLQKVFKKPKL